MDDYWWEWAMQMTTIADRTGWTPQQVNELPWRYRQNVVSCFNLLDEARGERGQ